MATRPAGPPPIRAPGAVYEGADGLWYGVYAIRHPDGGESRRFVRARTRNGVLTGLDRIQQAETRRAQAPNRPSPAAAIRLTPAASYVQAASSARAGPTGAGHPLPRSAPPGGAATRSAGRPVEGTGPAATAVDPPGPEGWPGGPDPWRRPPPEARPSLRRLSGPPLLGRPVGRGPRGPGPMVLVFLVVTIALVLIIALPSGAGKGSGHTPPTGGASAHRATTTTTSGPAAPARATSPGGGRGT